MNRERFAGTAFVTAVACTAVVLATIVWPLRDGEFATRLIGSAGFHYDA